MVRIYLFKTRKKSSKSLTYFNQNFLYYLSAYIIVTVDECKIILKSTLRYVKNDTLTLASPSDFRESLT